ncbi:MAG: Rab family GTPase [Promethearchaeota archaeon]
MEQSVYKGKCIIIGDNAVGKTSLISCFVEHKFPIDHLPTIGTNLYVKEIVSSKSKNKKFILTVWDIAGEKKWTVMRKLYYKGANGAFLVGDLTRKETFENLISFWKNEILQYCNNIPIVLLANKNDLDHEIDDEYLLKVSKEINAIKFFRTSAKTSHNVNSAFLTIVDQMIDKVSKL